MNNKLFLALVGITAMMGLCCWVMDWIMAFWLPWKVVDGLIICWNDSSISIAWVWLHRLV